MQQSWNVLVCDDYSPESLALLKSSALIEQVGNTNIAVSTKHFPDEELLQKANALLIRSRTPIKEKLLKLCPNLKVVVTATSGFDHIDIELCNERGVAVAFSPLSQVQSVAELTILLMLSLSRRTRNWVYATKNNWRSDIERGQLLGGKELGIVGLGRIGSSVAKLGQALGMNVISHDPYKDDEHFNKLNVTRMGYAELLRQSDIVSFHVPLTDETLRMLNRANLDSLSSHAWVINTSRGQVINEVDLCEALENAELGGAGLDVFEKEPLSDDSRLSQLTNVVLSPHIGAYSQEAFAAVSLEAVNNLMSYMRSGELANALTR